MGWILNSCYLLGLLILGPWLLWKRISRKKSLGGFVTKFFGLVPLAPQEKPRVWLHAVSVGEVLLLRTLLGGLRRLHPDYEFAISVSTTTGYDVARRTYPDHLVFWFPFDFTWAVRRALRRIKPKLIILAELELWPNFIRQAKRMGAGVVVVNGRLSQRSYQGYRQVRSVLNPMLQQVDLFAVQHEEYADRVKSLGVDSNKIRVTGSVKFDGAILDRGNTKTKLLKELFQIDNHELVWLVGSTQQPEEEWAIEMYRSMKGMMPKLRLILVPRHMERFNEVAFMLEQTRLPFVRKSKLNAFETIPPHAVILIDSLGDLGAAWGLADVGFVGGSFNDRGGQNMVEPAAFGVAVTFGPNTWNFKQVVERLLAEKGAIQVNTLEEWRNTTAHLLTHNEERKRLGDAARRFVISQQGATDRTLELLNPFLPMTQSARKAA